MDNQV